MSNDKLISVIVPVYKVEKYLDKCVESIVNQTYKNLEIILVDDGSPDNCPAMCDAWAEKDNRIKVIYKENGINVNICGNPSNLFSSTETVTIHPRLPLDKLKLIEDKTNVLIFLCNRQGGQIPGKIYQYSATNKTILFIFDGTDEEKKVLKEYFSKYNRYVFCENTVEDITRAIKDIENGNLGDVVNEPLTCFDSKDIIQNILDCKNG